MLTRNRLPFQYDDGGSEFWGYEDGDCMARAMTIATDGFVPYHKARDFCLSSILDYSPAEFHANDSNSLSSSIKFVECQKEARKGLLTFGTPTTRLFVERMAHLGFANHIEAGKFDHLGLDSIIGPGRWMVCLIDHATAVIDGTVRDMAYPDYASLRHGIYHAWEWRG